MALGGCLAGVASALEAASFVTGAVCVWLTVRQSAWNFPVGLLNAATFAVVFARSRLFADAGLQIMYFALNVHGWILWARGGSPGAALPVTRAERPERLLVAVAMVVTATALWRASMFLGGASSAADAVTTALSLGAQWLLNRKKLESWLLWIAVDVLYVPLYLSRGLFLTAILYVVFLGMAVIGWREWRRSA
jgi:nicotinamide mononucleotide transporter